MGTLLLNLKRDLQIPLNQKLGDLQIQPQNLRGLRTLYLNLLRIYQILHQIQIEDYRRGSLRGPSLSSAITAPLISVTSRARNYMSRHMKKSHTSVFTVT